MKNNILGWLVKMSAVIGLAVALRFQIDPTFYIFLGAIFYMGYQLQYTPELTPVKVPRQSRTVTVAKRI